MEPVVSPPFQVAFTGIGRSGASQTSDSIGGSSVLLTLR